MNKSIRAALVMIATCLLAGATSTSWAATSVGASFVGRNATPADVLAPAESAGVVPQPFWNNVFDDGSTFSGTTTSLLDNAGNFTSVKLVYTASDSWSSDGPTVTPNDKLMKGIIKANPNPDTAPTGGTDGQRFVITNLPPTGSFNVIVYATENGAGGEVAITQGATTYYVEEEASFPGNFIKATSTAAGAYTDANYAEFDGVTPAADGSITVTTKKNIVNPQVNDGIGIAGVQVVQVSGPALGKNADPCSVTADPASTLTVEGTPATFTVATAGPCAILWQKNGVAIPGAINPTYTTAAPTVGDNGAKFSALVYNNVITNKSADATLSVDANTPPSLTQGFLKAERWENIGGNTGTTGIDDLKAAITAGAPTTTFFVAGPNVPQSNPNISNFGIKISGWVKPDVTGDYDFFTRSDDPSQVFLDSTAAASGTNALPDVNTATPIAQEDGCCNAFQEPGAAQTTAAPIHLEAGKLYGLVVLQKEGGGGDFVQVAWRLTTDTTKAAALKTLPAANSFTLASAAGQRASITQQPQPATISEGKTATFSVGVTTTPVAGTFSVQWLTNGTPVLGASGTSFTTPIATLADNGTQVKARALTLVGALDSTAALLTVNVDTNPPVLLGATAFPGTTKVGLLFDKALDAVSAGTAANYKVNGAAVTSAVVRTNVANELTHEKNLVQLTVPTALTANFTVTVNGIKDFKGNTITTPTTVNGTILSLNITDIGSTGADAGAPDPQAPGVVTTWGPGAFDVLTTGSNDYWNNADGFNFVHSPRTNSFDVKVRVVSVSPINQWSAGAIEVREGPATPNGGGWELARHYFCKVDYGGPDPALDASGSGANSYEFNCRRAPGDPTVRETGNGGPGTSQGWGGAGPGNPSPVPYPNAWIRIARVKNGTSDHLFGYSSTDGINWDQREDVDLNDDNHAGFLKDDGTPAGPMPAVLYVGLGSVSHTGIANNNSINDGTKGGVNGDGTGIPYSPVNQPYSAYIIYRDFGDVASAPTNPTLALKENVDGSLTLTYTGTLYSSDTVHGTYTAVAGATSPFSVNPKTAAKATTFYQAGP